MYENHSSSKLFDNRSKLLIAVVIVDDSDCERAAGTFGDSFSLTNVFERDLELVATGTWIIEHLILGFEVEVFDLNFVIYLSRHCC